MSPGTSPAAQAAQTSVSPHEKWLWGLQCGLALVFVLAGGVKLVLTGKQLADAIPMPPAFLRFIGVAEVLGALGLVLPRWGRARPALTPLAAAGLTVIMIGAFWLMAMKLESLAAFAPLVVGALCTLVTYRRWPWLELS
ncbi:MAG: DoxX family protein [Polyangiales bacterium]